MRRATMQATSTTGEMVLNTNEATYTTQAWVVTLTASLFFFYTFIQLNLFNAIDVELMQAFHLNASQLCQLSSMFFYANTVFLFPAGVLLDRFSTKKILLMSVLLASVGTLVFGLAETYM